MSTTQPAIATRPDDEERTVIAAPERIETFIAIVESDPRVCPNCFGPRSYEYEHFRGSGGRATGQAPSHDRTADRFCTECWAGTGEPDLHQPHDLDYSNVTCHLPRQYLKDMGGTVEREWGEEAPLPLNGEHVSFFRCLCRLSDRLDERHYLHDRERLKERGETLKQAFPGRDWEIFARLTDEVVRGDR